MDHLRQIAEAYYRAGSSEFQSVAQELFNSLDGDGDGSIDKNEFVSFMTEESTEEKRDGEIERWGSFFNELDTDRNGTLDFWEVMTLLYIFTSKRPFCDCCRKFIPGTYFTCVQCHADINTQFDLCISCYANRRSGHSHQGKPAQFLDNYTLLDAKRSSGLNTNTDDDVNNISHVSASTHVATRPNNTAIVPAPKYEKQKLALQALQIALTIGNTCTIM